MPVINEETDEPTWEEVLQENREEAEELAEADDFKEEESTGESQQEVLEVSEST